MEKNMEHEKEAEVIHWFIEICRERVPIEVLGDCISGSSGILVGHLLYASPIEETLNPKS